MIAVLAGGVGAARLLSGLVQIVNEEDLAVIVNTGDDTEPFGLYVCPDLDTITYTLAGAVNEATGWGLRGESWAAMDALHRYGGPTWFRLGDRDLATHLFRRDRLSSGVPLSSVTAEIVAAWGLRLRLLPMTDDTVRTVVTLSSGEELAFQDYFVRLRHDVAVSAVRFDGARDASPGPGVLEVLERAEQIVLAPSNPILSLGPILSITEIADCLAERRRDVVAISPIVAGAALKGPADRLLAELGHEASCVGIARLLSRFAAVLVIDEKDAEKKALVEATGTRAVVSDTIMANPTRARSLAEVTLAARGPT